MRVGTFLQRFLGASAVLTFDSVNGNPQKFLQILDFHWLTTPACCAMGVRDRSGTRRPGDQYGLAMVLWAKGCLNGGTVVMFPFRAINHQAWHCPAGGITSFVGDVHQVLTPKFKRRDGYVEGPTCVRGWGRRLFSLSSAVWFLLMKSVA